MLLINFVAIAFKLINVVVLLGMGWYLFKRYALDTITTQMIKKQQKLADVALQNQLLKDQLKAMELVVANQQKVVHELLQKIDLWKVIVDQQRTMGEEEKKNSEVIIAQKVKSQQHSVELCFLEQSALLPAIEKAREILCHKYEAPVFGQSFMDEIIKNMEKSKA